MPLTFCHEDFHEVWFAVDVTFHAREVSQATAKTAKFQHTAVACLDIKQKKMKKKSIIIIKDLVPVLMRKENE